MELKEGMAFWLKGVFPGSKRIGRYGIIIGKREAITDAKGRKHEVWPALMPFNEGWIGHYYVDSRAPYFFGFENKNVMTGEVSMSVRLEEVQELK